MSEIGTDLSQMDKVVTGILTGGIRKIAFLTGAGISTSSGTRSLKLALFRTNLYFQGFLTLGHQAVCMIH